jgi:hypothetical protein
MINPRTQATRWAIAGVTALIGAILAAAGSEAWSIPGRVTVLETDSKTSRELLQEMRQDIKELIRRP